MDDKDELISLSEDDFKDDALLHASVGWVDVDFFPSHSLVLSCMEPFGVLIVLDKRNYLEKKHGVILTI
jgi:hypothetical protein